ncbi:GTPase ObgE [bacterium]|nr:GTPase ObgE [bacterium]
MVQFIDSAKIRVESGRGGDGTVAWRREKYVDKGGPAGGDGGRGGDVFFEGDEGLSTLLDFKYQSVFKAQNGEPGRSKNQYGKVGKDLIIKVPVGVIVKDIKTDKIIADINSHGQKVLIAKGGRGGRGNTHFATAQKRAPQFCEPGEPPVIRELSLELKLIADVGLLGMPNAGKSTFISSVSSARPKIADYPFTTLVPNLGVVKKPTGDAFVLADIPGLIEGASEGVGLGYEFLKHVQRCKFLLHIIDLTEENPFENYKKINNELKKYDEDLASRYQIIVLNKADAVLKELIDEVKAQFKDENKEIFVISAVSKMGVKELLDFVCQKEEEIEAPRFEVEFDEDTGVSDNDDSEYDVIKSGKDTFYVDGGKIRRLANVTDIRNSSQMIRFKNILDSMGVFEKLKKLGVKDGDTVICAHLEFTYVSDYY